MMATSNKGKIRALLKSIETGEPGPVAVVNEAKYVQHNPQTEEGSEGLAALFKRLSATNPRVNVVRDFATRRIGFEVFRFEDGQAVEYWDNIQPRLGPNEPRRSMVDGPVEATDLDRTEQNRAFVRNFVENVLVGGRINQLAEFVDANAFADHNPRLAGDAAALRDALEVTQGGGNRRIDYQRVHRVLAEGDFVLCVSEGNADGVHSAFYDLFRVAGGKLVEHWDTTEKIAPKSEWKNDNGKF